MRTKWDDGRLVSEMSVGDARIIETYERAANSSRLVVTTKMNMRGYDVSVRRVYDAADAR